MVGQFGQPNNDAVNQGGGQPGFGGPPLGGPPGGQPGFGPPPAGGQPGFGPPPAGGQPGFGQPLAGGQSGFGGPPGGSGSSWGQPNPQNSGPGKGVFIALGGVFATLVVLAGALFFVLRDDSDNSDEIAQPTESTVTTPSTQSTSTEPPPPESTEPAAPPQAVADGEFPLTLEDVNFPSDSTVIETPDLIIGGYCFDTNLRPGLLDSNILEFEIPVDSPEANPAFIVQYVVEFDSPTNAAVYFEQLALASACGSGVYTQNSGETFDFTIEVQANPTVYGDDTLELSVDATGNGPQSYYSREFSILDGSYIYYAEVIGFDEYPRGEMTSLLQKSASNLGLS